MDLANRLQQEQRLVEGIGALEVDTQNSLMNFIPTHSIADIAREYTKACWTMYEPTNYLQRCLQQCLGLHLLEKSKQTMQFSSGKGMRLLFQSHHGLRQPKI